MPGLVYCDLTMNRIMELSTVCEFARNTLNISYLDLTANPLLTKAQWKVRCPGAACFTVECCIVAGACCHGCLPPSLAQEEGWKLVAILTHLDSLNGAALTMEQHILANRKHGNVDDQRRLALRIYDEAFMKCAATAAAVSAVAVSR